MKQYTTIKVGYSVGVYGCSGEYFVTLYSDKKGNHSIHHEGLYGSEERINAVLETAGYKKYYTPSRFGKLTGEDKKGFLSEYSAVNELKKIFKL